MLVRHVGLNPPPYVNYLHSYRNLTSSRSPVDFQVKVRSIWMDCGMQRGVRLQVLLLRHSSTATAKDICH